MLLKNDAGALPLTAEDLASLALIGPTAGQLAAGFLGERAYGFEAHLVSPLDALRQLSPRAEIAYSVGVDLTGIVIPASALSHDGQPGLLRQPSAGESGPAHVDRGDGLSKARGARLRRWTIRGQVCYRSRGWGLHDHGAAGLDGRIGRWRDAEPSMAV